MSTKIIAKKLCDILYPNHTWSNNELYVEIDEIAAKEIWKICKESERNNNEVKAILGNEAYKKVIELRSKYNIERR